MTKNYLLAFMSLLLTTLFTSCEKINVADLEDSGTSSETTSTGLTINCKVSNTYETRTAVAAKDQVTRIAWALMKEDGTIVSQGEQTSEATSFGKLSIDCDAGSYKLLVFAHKAASACTIVDGGIVTMPDNKITDAFYNTQDVTVTKNKRKSLTCTLDRCIAKFTIKSTDVMPETVSKVRITFDNTSSKFNGLAGLGDGLTSYTRLVTSLSSYKNTKVTFNVYFFLPTTEATTANLKFEFLSDSDEALYTDNFANVPVQINHATVYNGAVFTSSGIDSDSDGILVNADWGTDFSIDENYLE